MKKGVPFLRTLLSWLLCGLALVPAIYANNTLTPSQNAKTLFLRALLMLSSGIFAYLVAVSSSFRQEVAERIQTAWKHPLMKVMAGLFLALLVSTIFAYHKDIGFFGEPERQEGFLGLSFFYMFFAYAVVLFKKKDWFRFFGFAMVGQVPVALSAFYQFAHGLNRTNSILGNPIYFAVYALCMLAVSAVVWIVARKERKEGLLWASGASAIVAMIDLFLGNTRSVLLGVSAALVITLIYAGIRAQVVFPRKNPRRVRVAIGTIFAALALFSGVFFATREASFWTHIPGLDRIAQSSASDATTQARLVSWNIALTSISPVHSGLSRFLFGWGWDNYFYAWQKNYNPALYQYDTAAFDRPHNKLLDMLVMNGIIGLVLYLALWYFFIRAVIRLGSREPGISVALLFWGAAFFIQNIFAFDSIISWVFSFSILAFVIFESSNDGKK